ncbi:MaoC family dehydratase [Lacrimispora sp.]|uniref:MaoC family dehydratase n=1 Tax=Lacrimispora sp. TaxID=2719234 RepID=UPI00289A25F5|nr:MaoC family dehydratase [Lacrimispora sp.]
MKGLTIDQINVGDSAEFSKTITESDIYQFAGITGDFNPAHINAEYAKNTIFEARIAHGMLISSLFSTILGTSLPGPGTIYMGQEVRFVKPVYINDTITAVLTVIDIIEEKNRLKLETVATNQNGEIVVQGNATVMAPK